MASPDTQTAQVDSLSSEVDDGERILVLLPAERDAVMACAALVQGGMRAKVVSAMEDLCREIAAGAGAVLIAEEALAGSALQHLTYALALQSSWSDIPLLVLTSDTQARPRSRIFHVLDTLGNATLVERPVRVLMLVSAVQMALRTRRRQYLMREYLADRDQTARAVREASQREQALLAEAKTTRSELERMLECITDGFMTLDRTWRFTHVNERAASVCGMPRQDILGRDIWELLPERRGSLFYTEAQRAMMDRTVVQFEYFDTSRDQWFDCRIYPQSQGIAVFETDITQRKQAETERLLSETREHRRTTELQAMMETVPAVILIARDPRCTRIDGNPAAYALMRLPAGTNLADGQELSHLRMTRDGVPLQLDETPMHLAAAGQTVRDTELTIEFDDGSVRHLHGNAAPLLDDHGRICGAVGGFIDITERENALRINEERFRAAVKNSPIVVFNQDQELRYTWVQHPAFGLGVEDIIGKRDADLLERPEEAQVLEGIKRHVLENGVGSQEQVRLHHQGIPHYFDLTIEPLRDSLGRVVGITCAALEITQHVDLRLQLRRQTEQLARADQRKNEFLAMLAHELRNPLAPIYNAVHVLRIQPDPPDVQHVRWALDVIGRQLQHLTRLVDDLLDVARITHGRIKLRTKTLDLGELVSEAVEAARPLMATRAHHVRVSLPREPIWVTADPTRLMQVIGNLLNNAARYTEPGGQIDITLTERGGGSFITVRDTGSGIAPERLEQIFDLFSTEDRGARDAQAGLGLGLTLVRRLVELHGGSVRADSKGLGQGSEFTVQLPRHSPQDAPADGDTAADTERGRRVLVIDDNRDVVDSFARLLGVMGHRVQTAVDGESAVTIAREFRPEIIFLDIGLPTADGYEIARRLRADAGGRDFMLVALTGYDEDDVNRKARAAGFDDILLKPPSIESLAALLTTSVARKVSPEISG